MSQAQALLSRLNLGALPEPPSEDEEDDDADDVAQSPGSIRSILSEDDHKGCGNTKHQYPLNSEDIIIFSWGWGHKFQLGHGESDTQVSPTQAPLLTRLKIQSIGCSAGDAFAFGVTATGRTFTWGTGLLGLGPKKPYSPSPHLVLSLKNIRVRQVACSKYHTLALSTDRQVFGWGTHVLTGLERDCETAEHIEFLDDKNVSRLECSETYSIALPVSGKAYSWGYPGPWLGLGEDASRLPETTCAFGFIEIPEEPDYAIAVAATATEHLAFVTSSGGVYTCGVGHFGKLGHGDETSYHQPKRVDALSSVSAVMVSCGHEHTGILTSKGKIHTCGQGWYYQLGHGNQGHSFVPTQVSSVADEKLHRILCIESRTYGITAYGSLVVWGFDPVTQMAYAIPKVQEHLDRFRVYDLVGGEGFTIAITSTSSRQVRRPIINRPDTFVPPVDESAETGPRRHSAPAKESLVRPMSLGGASRRSTASASDLQGLMARRKRSSSSEQRRQSQKYFPSTFDKEKGRIRYDFSKDTQTSADEHVPPVRVYSWQMESVEFAKPASLEVKKMNSPKPRNRGKPSFPDPPRHLPPPPEGDISSEQPAYRPRRIRSHLVRRSSGANRLKIGRENGDIIGFVIITPESTTLRTLRRQISEELDEPPASYYFVFNGNTVDTRVEDTTLAKPFLPLIHIREV